MQKSKNIQPQLIPEEELKNLTLDEKIANFDQLLEYFSQTGIDDEYVMQLVQVLTLIVIDLIKQRKNQ